MYRQDEVTVMDWSDLNLDMNPIENNTCFFFEGRQCSKDYTKLLEYSYFYLESC